MKLTPDRPSYHSHPDDAWTPVLVAVVNNSRDFDLARDQHWYRIPVNRAPRQIAAEYLALYQTSAFGPEGQHIRFYAPILRYHLLTRADLLPGERDHPRASDQYFKIEIGDLQSLDRPIPNHSQPRLTFIYTTFDRLFQATEIKDLWLRSAARERLYAAVKERGLAVECWYPVEMGDRPEADLALFGPEGRLTIYIDEPAWEELDEPNPGYPPTPTAPSAEDAIHIDARMVLRDPAAVLGEILRERPLGFPKP